MKTTDQINALTGSILRAAIAVHKELGPGLFESVYQKCLALELELSGIRVLTEVPVPVTYRGRQIQDEGMRIDLLVDDEVIVELKSCDGLKDVHRKQLLTYLKLADKRVGLLINFNVAVLKEGVERIVYRLEEPARNVVREVAGAEDEWTVVLAEPST